MLVTNLNGTYMEPSKEVLEELIKLGYTPIKKNILKKALEKGFMFFIKNNTIYYRDESELEGYTKVEMIEDDETNQYPNSKTPLDMILDSLKNLSNYKEEDIPLGLGEKMSNTFNPFKDLKLFDIGFNTLDITQMSEENNEVEETPDEVTIISVQSETKEYLFEEPEFYCDLLAVKTDPNYQDDVIVGFVIEDNSIVAKVWSTTGQDLTNGTHNLTLFSLPWYFDENNFPALVEVGGTFAKAIEYVPEAESIGCMSLNGTQLIPTSYVNFIKKA